MQTARPILTLVVIAALSAAFSPADLPGGQAGTPTTAPARPESEPETPAKMLMKEIPGVSMVKVPLVRVMEQYGKLSGLTIQADWNELETVGITKATLVTLKVREIRFDKLLDLTLNSIAPKDHPLSWYLFGTEVKVSTQMRILLRNRIALLPLKEAESSLNSQDRPKPRLGGGLREIDFSELPLKDAVEFLRNLSGLNFHVNWRAMEATGVTGETPVTVKAKDISIARALDLVTDQLNTGRDRYSGIYWLISDGVVEISTGEALDRTTSVRVYEVGDLLTLIPDFKGPNITLSAGGNSTNNNSSSNNSVWGDNNGSSNNDNNNTADNITEQQKQIRDTLIEIIKFSIGEDMWAPTGKGSIKILQNRMIISQTPLGFKLLERSMRR